ncbi:MAG: CaiB/BaiF CoA-transferase family protein, partial [Actinomycetota bacterium]
SINGFGSTGPYSSRPVLDPVIQGLCGIIDRQVNPQIPFPDMVRNLFCDKSTALQAAQAVTAALFAREKGAGGQFIEIPMIDAGMYMFWPDGMMDMTMLDDDASGGIRLATVYNLTECSDGKIVYFAASDAQRNGVSVALGHPEWAEDERFNSMLALAQNPENFVLLGEMLTEAFAELTCEDALARLVEADVPCGPVLTAEESMVDPQIVHNETLIEWEHPVAGTIRQPRPAARFSKTPAAAGATASLRGGDNDSILADLGRSADDITALRESGAIG